MLYYFTNSKGQPVAYKAQIPEDAWIHNKGKKSLTVLRSACWNRMGAIGGVYDVPHLTEIEITPSANNNQTIGVKYVVERNGKYYIGYGSSNEYSVVKKVDVYKNNGKPDKTVVSGNALHALEMATKRAKIAAIATALGFDHNDSGDIVESIDYVINPNLRKISPIGYKRQSLADLSKIERAKVIPVEQLKKTPLTSIATESEPTTLLPPTTIDKQSSSNQTSKHSEQKTNIVSTPKPFQESRASDNKPAISKPSTSAPTTPNEITDDDPSGFVMPFGKYKGKALITILSEDSGYIKWIVDKSTSADIKAKATALLNKLPNLAKQPVTAPKPGNTFKQKLKDFWKQQGYNPKTEVKNILEKTLNKSPLKYSDVTEEEAKELYAKKESLFPNKSNNSSTDTETGAENALDTKTKALLGKAKCCVCEIELKEPEIKVSLKKASDLGGRMMCFRHVRLSQEQDTTNKDTKCEKCQKVLDQQELDFIKEYDSAQLCTECQVG